MGNTNTSQPFQSPGNTSSSLFRTGNTNTSQPFQSPGNTSSSLFRTGNTNTSQPLHPPGKTAIHVAGPRDSAAVTLAQQLEKEFPSNTLIVQLNPTGPTQSQWTKIRGWQTSPTAHRNLLMVGSVDRALDVGFPINKTLVDNGQTLNELDQGYFAVRPGGLVTHLRVMFQGDNPNYLFAAED
jgi:hypothetical protein